MRVTNNITTGQFLRNNNRALSSMLQSHNRIMTQRRFNRVSEDSINGSKAITIRRQLRDLSIYNDTLSTSKEILASAESNLYNISDDIYINLEGKLVAAVNGTYDSFDMNIFATEIESLGEHMIQTMNGDFAERQLFGGTSNDPVPFSVIEEEYQNPDGTTGKRKVVTYNGVALDEQADPSQYPGANPIYVDIGLGIKYDEDYNIDPQTALDISLNGAEILGCGVDEDGYSKNLIQLVYDAADALRKGDKDTVNAIIDRANTANNHILTKIAELGTKQNSIEFYLTKNEDYKYSLKERQNLVEGTDLEAEISNYESIKAAYDATLKIGAQLLPNSIFDFI